MTIALPPELEFALTERAKQKGTTPELVALDGLRDLFMVDAEDSTRPEGETMAEYMAEFIGCLDSSEFIDGKSDLSENTGRKFTELMLKKRRDGKL